MKHVRACLGAREDQESSLDHCGGPVRSVLAYSCAEHPDNAVLTSEKVL